jgi:hypothetical protein
VSFRLPPRDVAAPIGAAVLVNIGIVAAIAALFLFGFVSRAAAADREAVACGVCVSSFSLTLSARAKANPASHAGGHFSRDEGCLPASVQQALAGLRQIVGDLEIISTWREGATIAGTHHASLHRYCRAVDFKVARGMYVRAVTWLRAHHAGGVGTYSGAMHHIHIDDGSSGRRWHTRVRIYHRHISEVAQ